MSIGFLIQLIKCTCIHSVICLRNRFMTVSSYCSPNAPVFSCFFSNLCNSFFLISRLLTISFFYLVLLFFYPISFLLIHHAATIMPYCMAHMYGHVMAPYCVEHFSIFLNHIQNFLICLPIHKTLVFFALIFMP